MRCTALVLSASAAQPKVPGAQVLVHVSQFGDAAGLLDARLKAIGRVETERFFFLDDDDGLPENFGDVLEECLARPEPLVYTDELIREGGAERVRKSGAYSQAAHLADMTLVHRLAVCDTAAAQAVAGELPRGQYGFEPLFYWQMAKRGAAYVPRVGYVWNKGAGMHRTPDVRIAMVLAQQWAKENP